MVFPALRSLRFRGVGAFRFVSVAKKYAGSHASNEAIKAYTDGWSKWSNGVLRPNTEIHLASDDEMLVFAKAEFAYEAAAPSPVDGKQILLWIFD